MFTVLRNEVMRYRFVPIKSICTIVIRPHVTYGGEMWIRNKTADKEIKENLMIGLNGGNGKTRTAVIMQNRKRIGMK